MSLAIRSPAFEHHGTIPQRYTCDGDDLSPPLEWSGIPPHTHSLVLIVDDPDAPDPSAPRLVFVHWLLYNIPPNAGGLLEGRTDTNLPAGTLSGITHFNRTAYGGPCPPIGRHRYFHKLYALDTILDDLNGPDKDKLMDTMNGHIIEHDELIGTYQRNS